MSDFSIGERIKYYRAEKGLTQKELAKQTNLALGTIQQYEAGKRKPRLSALISISKVLGAPSLLMDIDPQENNETDINFLETYKMYNGLAEIRKIMLSANILDDENTKDTAQKVLDINKNSILPLVKALIPIEIKYLTDDGLINLQSFFDILLKDPKSTTDEYKQLLDQSETKKE